MERSGTKDLARKNSCNKRAGSCDGDTLAGETNPLYTVYYLYGLNGEAIGCVIDGVTLYYVKNLQGDVTALIKTDGTVAGTYTYDPWGKVTVSGYSEYDEDYGYKTITHFHVGRVTMIQGDRKE